MIAHINMSWVTRVYRDDLVTFQVDGTHGSAVAGLTDCVIQARSGDAAAGVEPGRKRAQRFYADWQKVPENVVDDNGFKEQWEMFIRHVCEEAPYRYTLLEGARACNSPNARCRAGANGAGSTSPRSRCEEA